MYLTIGILVALGSILVPSLIGALLSRENIGKTFIIAAVFTAIYAGIVWLVSWGFSVNIYGPTPLFGWIIIGAIIAAIIARFAEETFVAAVPGILIALIGIIYLIVIAVGGNDYRNAKEKAKLFQVETKEANAKVLELADPAHICLVTEAMAKAKAENVLGKVKTSDNANAGSRYVLGSGTKQYVDGQLWWIFPLEFDGYWKWKKFPTVPGFLRMSAENPKAEAEAVQYNKQGKPIVVKYLNTASFDNLAERYLRNNGYLQSQLQDWTFEVDDNWNPYYTVSNIEFTIAYGAPIVKGIIVFDVQTGKFIPCLISEVGKKFPWIDRAYDKDVIDYQAIKWGEYSQVGWSWTDAQDGQRKKPTPGWYMTYDKDKCYWFTGWTSYSASSDLIGVSLTDANTGKTIYFTTQGATENVALEVAKTQWKNFPGYEPTEPIPYNVYGILTYVMPVVNGTQFCGVSLVAVTNKDINAKGATLEEALSNYRSSMGSVNNDRGVPYEGQVKKLSITTKIAEVGMPFIQGQNQMYPFTLQGIDKIFQINYTLQNAKVSFLKPGREVTIIYMDTKEKVITCVEFDIPDIKLTDQNPAQARWVENQKAVKQETQRIKTIQEN